MSFLGAFSNMEGGGGGGNTADGGGLDETCAMFSLTKTQRLWGFGICLCIGFVLSLMGTLVLLGGNVTSFAVLYTIGNIVSLMGTGFLIGPLRQFKTMFDPVRIVATIVFFVSMGLTIAFAFISGFGGLCIVFVVVQYCAFIWYTLSYIPYGRAMMKKCVGGICDF